VSVPFGRTWRRSTRRRVFLACVFLTVGVIWASAPSRPGGEAAVEDKSAPAASRLHRGAEPHSPVGHANPVVPVLLGVLIMLVCGKIAAHGLERLGQPPVLGELLAGVALGAVSLSGLVALDFLSVDPGLQVLAELGAIILLFEVGLECDLAELRSVGMTSLAVACIGVVVPFALGWIASAWLLPAQPALVHVFIGATLCATSVGITARVLADLGRLQDKESQIILGAAVLDDVLGLLILAVVTGAIAAANRGSTVDLAGVAVILGKAAIFLGGALVVGGWMSRALLRMAAKLQARGALLVASLSFCFLLSWLADLVGLATIVGAFAAGLVLDEVHFHDQRRDRPLRDLLSPIAAVLVPLFFVRMGVEVDLRVFTKVQVLGLALAFTVAAVVGKLACALGVLERGVKRFAVAMGMLPRGEVGLIFAGVGAQLLLDGQRVVNDDTFSALVVMVIVTTVVGPPLLRLAFSGRETPAVDSN